MSDYPQPGLHPDADSLSAFMEDVLPEHERLRCLAHLAECASCREVVYLAQEPVAAEPLPAHAEKKKVPFFGGWFRPVPALGLAALVGILVVSVWFYQRGGSAPREPELAVSAPPITQTAAAPAVRAPEMEGQAATPSPPALKARAAAAPRVAPRVVPGNVGTPEAKDVAAPAAASPATASAAARPAIASRSVPVAAPPPPVPAAKPTFAFAPAAAAGIAGTVTDAAGAVVPGATVKLSPLASPASQSLTTDKEGRFNIDGITPGRYELQTSAPGFKMMTEQIDVQPGQTARADTILQIGDVTTSISVTAASAQVQLTNAERPAPAELPARAFQPPAMAAAASAAVSRQNLPMLPSKLPAATTVVNGKVTLAIDSAGALFISENAGKKWSAVKPVWNGKVVSVSAADPAFQLTTDSGAVWLSRDGSHWYSAPAQK